MSAKPEPEPSQPSMEEMMECLNRSGYLLEARLVTTLANMSCFVESSASYLDPETRKSREIDIVAEYFDFNSMEYSSSTMQTNFVIEAINNLYPIVLLTPSEPNPYLEADDLVPKFFRFPDQDNLSSEFFAQMNELFDEIIGTKWYCQYCGFTRKKESKHPLMALHPDDLYSSISKSAEYSIQAKKLSFEKKSKSNHPKFLGVSIWHPLIVVKSDLYTLNDETLTKADKASLVFNFHFNGERESLIVTFVTEAHFKTHMNWMIGIDRKLGKMLAKAAEGL